MRRHSDKPAGEPLAGSDIHPAALMQAELCLQRGDFLLAERLLKRRLEQTPEDMLSLNLMGVTKAQTYDFEQAAAMFQRVMMHPKVKKKDRDKATFNYALVRFYQTLDVLGDTTVAGQLSNVMLSPAPIVAHPYAESIEVWEQLLMNRCKFRHIIYTYLSFTYLLLGDLERAVDRLMDTLSTNDSFVISSYVSGKLFLELYYLSEEGNDYSLTDEAVRFFEIEKHEITGRQGDRFIVHRDTFLDIAMQSFLDGRYNPRSGSETLLGLCHTYLLAGLFEEAHETLLRAEELAPDSLGTLETSLRYHQMIQSPPDLIRSIVARIEQVRGKPARTRLSYLIPTYYIF